MPNITQKNVEHWFATRGMKILPFQREAWRAYAKGESGLIHSPTGSGKSLAAWFGPVLAHGNSSAKAPPMTVLWITPLRALAVDTQTNLRAALQGVGLDWRLESRTGDTSAAVRTRQRKRLPTALVTTPESLSLLLSYKDTARQFDSLQAVVVDEWHELLGSKRGVQLQLCLAHLRTRVSALRVWGLSATIGNVQEAADVLLGPDHSARIIRGKLTKKNQIVGVLPDPDTDIAWAGHLGLQMLPKVAELIEQANTTLLFTNTRSQAERWFDGLTRAKPEWLGELALHHGSLEPALRTKVESLLRAGEVRCVVATSSLDLGVDFSPVDQVIQVGSPKGVARLLQRAGRSGHQPRAVSRVHCVPTFALELIEIAAAREAAARGEIESRVPPTRSLDVLCQHLVTLALAGGVDPARVLEEARSTHAYQTLSDAEWRWLLDFVTRGGPALHAYPQFRRLDWHGKQLKVATRRIANNHRMAVGTISSDASIRVQFQSGGYLGMVEEAFIARLSPGDVFLFAGRALEFRRVHDMVAHVRLAKKKAAVTPRWQGGRMPLSTELSQAILQQFSKFENGKIDSPELARAAGFLGLQAEWSALPAPGRLLVERLQSREGTSLYFYPFAGRLVHQGLAALFSWRIGQSQAATITMSANDYGFELLSREPLPFDEEAIRGLFCAESLTANILSAVNATEMSKRQFRDIARIAGLVFQGYPGARKTTRQVQASSSLIYEVLTQYDAGNELPKQALREVLTEQFELERLRHALAAMQKSTLVLQPTAQLTPLSFPLWAERLSAKLSTESWTTRVAKMRLKLDKAAGRTRAGKT